MAFRRRSRKRSFKRRGSRRIRDTAPVTQYHDSRTPYTAKRRSRGSGFRQKAQSYWKSAFIQNTPVEVVNFPYAGQISATASAAVQSIGGLFTFNATYPWSDLAALATYFRKGQTTLLNAAGSPYQAPKFMITSAHVKILMTNTTAGITYVRIAECMSRRSCQVQATDPSSLLLPDTNYMDNYGTSAAESLNKISYDLFDVSSFTSNMKILKIREVCLQASQSFEMSLMDNTHRIFNPEDIGPTANPSFYYKDWTKFFVVQAYSALIAGSPPTLANVQLPYIVDKKYYCRKIPGEYTTQTVQVSTPGYNI